MQTLNTTSAPIAAPVISEAPELSVANSVTEALDPHNAAEIAKPRAAKPAAKPVKPTVVPAAATDTSDRIAERLAARSAIADYYSGAGKSIPFKSASDTFAPLRLDKPAKAPTTRQAALLAAMLISGDNVKANGNFTRGGFIFDGKHVQPETGCLSDMLGRTVTHISGPLIGKQARDAIFRIDLKRARIEIAAHLGDKLAKQAIAKLDKLSPVKPAKPAKAA